MHDTASHSTVQPPTAGERVGLSEDQTLLGLLIIGLFVCGAMAVWQDDSFWHLRCGQLIWQERSVPREDSFSFALPPHTDWPNHEWLAQVLLYGLYRRGGLPLASLAVGGVLAVTGVVLVRAMAGSMERRFLLLLVVLPWIVAALSVRPQVLTLLAMSLQLLLLTRGRHWLLPPLFLVWANVHGGVALGGLLMCGWAAGTLWFDRRQALKVIGVTAACGAATLLTPMGWRGLLFPLHSVSRLKTLNLDEWMAPGFSDWQHLYFWLLLAAFLALAAIRWPRLATPRPRTLVLAGGLFGAMAVLSARNIPNFLLVAAVAAAHAFPMPAQDRRRPTTYRKHLWVLGVFGAAGAAAIVAAYRLPWQRLNWQPMPAAVVAALRACPDPVFNTYNTGGYLLWFTPERKVFCDSRQDPYPLDLLQQTIRAQQTSDYRELFDRHGFRAAILEPHWPLGRRLREDGWRETCRDRDWLILER